MASSITDQSTRLAFMLRDCHNSIEAAYFYTQPNIDQMGRPAFLIFPEDASYDGTAQGQEQYEQSFSIAYIGQPYVGTYIDFAFENEELAREVADAAVLYLLEHQNMSFSNTRNLEAQGENGLNGVMWIKVNNRSAVTLYSREATTGASGFWGFSIDIAVKTMLAYNPILSV